VAPSSELGPPTPEPTSTSGRRHHRHDGDAEPAADRAAGDLDDAGKDRRPQAVASTTSGRARSPPEQPRLPLVTRIGDEGWAITTPAPSRRAPA
jgi:hypothetical protein